MHVDDVPPVENVLLVQAVQTLLAKEYPALHDVTAAEHDEAIAPLYVPVVQAEHVDDVPPVEKVLLVQAVHTLLARE